MSYAMIFRVLAGLGFGALFLISGIANAAEPTSAPGKTSPELRLQVEGKSERLVTQGEINDEPVTVAFDTGMAVPFLVFSHALPRLGVNVATPVVETAAPMPGRAAMGITSPLSFRALGLFAREVPAFIAEFPLFVQEDQQSDCMLGWPALRDNIVEFSLGAQRPALRALRAMPTSLPGAIKLVVADTPQLTLHFASGSPDLPRLVIDTGNPGGVFLRTDRWQAWRLSHQRAARTLEGSIMFGQQIQGEEIMWADEIKIGKLTLRGVPVARAEAAYNGSIKPGEDFVVMGLAALKRVVLVVDAKNKRGLIAANPAPPVPYIHNRLGVVFLPRNDTSEDLVARVTAHGPAAVAGLHNADILLKVNGEAMAGWRENKAILKKMYWENPALSSVILTLQRGDQIFDQTLVAQNIIGPATIPKPGRASAAGDKQEQAFNSGQIPLKVNLEASEVFGVLASILDANGDTAAALENLDRAVEVSPNDWNAAFQRGIYKQRSGDPGGAMDDYDRAIALNPQNGDIYNNRGALKISQEDLPGAMQDFDHAVALSPRNADFYFDRALLEEKLGQLDKAGHDFNQAVTLDPERQAEAFSGRGRVKQSRGDLTGAAADGKRALALHLLERARASYEQNHRDEALIDLNDALKEDPSNGWVYRERASLRLEEGDVAGAAADNRQATKLLRT